MSPGRRNTRVPGPSFGTLLDKICQKKLYDARRELDEDTPLENPGVIRVSRLVAPEVNVKITDMSNRITCANIMTSPSVGLLHLD